MDCRWCGDQKRRHEFRDVEASVVHQQLSVDIPVKRMHAPRGLNLNFDTETRDLYEASWLHELFAYDNSIPFHATSSNGEVFNERTMNDERLPFLHSAMDAPSAVLEPSLSLTHLSANGRSWSLASAQLPNCLVL